MSQVTTTKQSSSSCCSGGVCSSTTTTTNKDDQKNSSPSSSSLISDDSTGISYQSNSAVYTSVQEYYGKILSTSKDLKTSACTSGDAPHPLLRSLMSKVPSEVLSKYYGCGTPLPAGGISGLSVLDLGSGSGRDVYVAAMLTGPKGKAVGIDMTEEQLEVARRNVPELEKTFGAQNLAEIKFYKGFIEDITGSGIEKNSIDMVISNCVVNLSPDKEAVLRGVYDVLKDGGEFHFSDVYCDRRLPSNVRSHELLFGECIAGALYINDFKSLCEKVGFLDPRELKKSEIIVNDPAMRDLLGNARFYSITYRLFKLKDLEPKCEDYGQMAIYKGDMDGTQKHFYALDSGHVFERNKPALVCGNTASMLSSPSWLGRYFEVIGNRNVHYGAFDCSQKTSSLQLSTTEKPCTSSSSSSCSGSSCC